MTMYDRIRKLRIEQGLSQEYLALKVGYKGRSMIARIESGSVDLAQSKIKAFAAALGTTVDYLMDDQPSHSETFKAPAPQVYEPEDETERKLKSLFAAMSDSDKEKLLDYAEFIVSSNKRKSKGCKK